MTKMPFSVSRPSVARLLGTLAAGSMIATPLLAQVAPPPVMVPTTPQQIQPPAAQIQMAPPATVQPLPQAAPAVAIPALSEAQAGQLATLIAGGEVAQGLRQGPPRDLTTLSPAALTRVALDYAHAVHVGRLDAADFTKDLSLIHI